MADGKVTIKVNLDKGKLESDIRNVKSQLSSLGASADDIDIKAKVSGTAKADLDAINASAADVEGNDPTVTVNAVDDASEVLTGVANASETVEGSDPTVTIEAADNATEKLDNIAGAAEDLDAENPIIAVSAADNATDKFDSISGAADDLDAENPIIAVNAADNATSELAGIGSVADDIDAKSPDIDVGAEDNATAELDAVGSVADTIDAKSPDIDVTADTSAATSSLNALDADITAKSSRWSSLLQGVGQYVGGKAIELATGTVGSIFSAGFDFDEGMAKIYTLMPDDADMDAMGSDLLDMALEYGLDINNLTDAAYEALSAGIAPDAVMAYLEDAAKLGIGGFTTTVGAGGAVASIMNAYGMDTADPEQRARILNTLLKTQNYGSTTVDQLSHSIYEVSPFAAMQNVAFEEVGAGLSIITAKGTPTSTATTQMKRLYEELGSSSGQASAAMAAAFERSDEYRGMSFSQVMASGANMVDVLKLMSEYAADAGLSMADLFSSSEAASAALMIMGQDGGAQYLEFLGYMTDGTDAVSGAYGKMSETFRTKWGQVKAVGTETLLGIFDALAPSLDKLLEIMTSDEFKAATDRIVTWIAELMESDLVIHVIDGIIAAIDTLLALLSGDITLGEVLMDSLEQVFDWLMELVGRGLIVLINGVLGLLPDWITGGARLDYDTLYGDAEPAPAAKLIDVETGEELTTYDSPAETRSFGARAIATAGEFLQNLPAIETAIDILGTYHPLGIMTTAKTTPEITEDMSDREIVEEILDSSQPYIPIFDEFLGLASRIVDFSPASENVPRYAREERDITVGGMLDNDDALPNLLGALGRQLADAENATSSLGDSAGDADAELDDAAVSARGISAAAQACKSAFRTAMLAIRSLAAQISGANTSVNGNISITRTPIPAYAIGLDRVPYDNYQAILHAGEMVLNAPAAAAYRMTRELGALTGGSSGGIDYAELARAMGNIGISMDGKKVGTIVERGVSARQYARAQAYSRIHR